MLERDIHKCLQTAQRFEATSIASAQNKKQYEQSMQDKLEAIRLKRQQSAQMTQNGAFNAPNGGMNNGSNLPMQNQMGLSVNPMFLNATGNQMPNNLHMNDFPAHAHLQRPMQASPLPPQQQQTTMDPSLLAGTPHMSNSFARQITQPRSDPNPQLAQQTELPAELQSIAQRMMATIPEAKKHELRAQLLQQMSEQQRQSVAQRQIDPLRNWVVSKARMEFLKRNGMLDGNRMPPSSSMPQQNSFQFPGMQNANMSSDGQNLDDQSFVGGMAQNGMPQSANDFTLSQLYGQQQSALKLQESGEQVVPISNNNAGLQYMNMIKNMGNSNTQPMIPQMSNGSVNQLNAANTQRQALIQQQQARQKQVQDQIIAQRNMQANLRAMNQRQPGQSANMNMPNAFNAPSAVSPAMSMLNRPVQPPINHPSNTPAQKPSRPNQQQVSSVNDLSAHHQNMVNQSNGQGPSAAAEAMKNAPQPLSALLNSLEPVIRNKILSMNPNDRTRALAQLKQMHDRKQQAAQQQASVGKDLNAGPNIMTAQMNNPGLSMQPMPQQNASNVQSDEALQAQQRQKQQLRVHAMLSRPLPPGIDAQLQIVVPPSVQYWSQLRAHIQQNRALFPPEMPQILMQAMDRHFSSNPAELQQAIQELIVRQRQQAMENRAQMSQRDPSSMNGLSAQASSAQVQNNPATMQALQQLTGGNIPQVTPQEIARFRMTHKVDAKVPDDGVRHALIQQKLKDLRNRQQQVQAMASGVQAAGQPGMPNPQPPGSRPPAMQTNQNKPPQTSRRLPQDVTNDDVLEIANPNLPAGQSKQSTREQQLKLQQQMAAFGQSNALQSKQVANTNYKPGMQSASARPEVKTDSAQATSEAKALVLRLYQAIGPPPQKSGPVMAQPEEINEVRKLFQKMWKPVQMLDSTLTIALRHVPSFTEQSAKELLRSKQILMQNMADEHGNIRDHLARPLHELRSISDSILRYYTSLQAASRMNAERAAQPPAPAASPAMPIVKSAGRKSSAATKPPAAPTDEKKFWAAGVASPHGVPKYDNKQPELTADQLKFPPQKKRKTGPGQPTSQPTTPAQATATTKSVTPVSSVKPTDAAVKTNPERTRFRCPKSDICDFSITGFDTEVQLREHINSVHQVIEDPLRFLIDSTTEAPSVVSRKQTLAIGRPGDHGKTAAVKAKRADQEKTMQDLMLERLGYTDQMSGGQQFTATDAKSENIFDDVGDIVMSGLQDFDVLDIGQDTSDLDWGLRRDEGHEISSPELTPESQASLANSDISLNDRLKINLEWDAFGYGGFQMLGDQALDDLSLDSDLPAQQRGNDVGKAETMEIDASGDENTMGADGGAWNWDAELMNWDFADDKPSAESPPS